MDDFTAKIQIEHQKEKTVFARLEKVFSVILLLASGVFIGQKIFLWCANGIGMSAPSLAVFGAYQCGDLCFSDGFHAENSHLPALAFFPVCIGADSGVKFLGIRVIL